MNTKFKAGLYQDEQGRVVEVAEHPDEGCGWLAYPVREITKRTSTEGFAFEIHRAKSGARHVSIELWLKGTLLRSTSSVRAPRATASESAKAQRLYTIRLALHADRNAVAR